MYRIRPEDDMQKLPKPCEVFDVIVGTSTGGLIAIMLGILVSHGAPAAHWVCLFQADCCG